MSEDSEDPNLDWKKPILFCIYAVCFLFLFHYLYKGIKRRCLRRRTARRLLSQNNPGDASPRLESGGLASAIAQSLPAIQFGEKTKQREDDDGHSACSICLGEFEEGEWLRLLPNCAHIFHVSCVDPWFLSHSTCPLCRTVVLGDSSNNGDSSASTTALWGTLPREETHQGGPLGYNLLQSEAIRNRELRWEAVRGDRPGLDSGESFPSMGPSSIASTSNV